jgi:hypothetical protein
MVNDPRPCRGEPVCSPQCVFAPPRSPLSQRERAHTQVRPFYIRLRRRRGRPVRDAMLVENGTRPTHPAVPSGTECGFSAAQSVPPGRCTGEGMSYPELRPSLRSGLHGVIQIGRLPASGFQPLGNGGRRPSAKLPVRASICAPCMSSAHLAESYRKNANIQSKLR